MLKKFPLRRYTWSGWSADHKKTSGEIQAPTLALARMELLQQGLTIISLRKTPQLWRFHSAIKKTDIAIFFRQLAALINAGIPLVQSLEILQKNQEQPDIQTLLQSIKNDVEAGKNLAQAFARHTSLFEHMTCQLIHIGEQTGTLDNLLSHIAAHQEKTLALQAKLKQALIYPGFVLTMALIITAAMLVFVVPRFEDIFANFQVPLPAMTRHVIACSRFISNNYWLSGLPVLLYYSVHHYYRTSLRGKKALDKILLALPWMGSLYQKASFVRIARLFGIMIYAGMSITHSLELLTQMSSKANYFIHTALLKAQSEINAGRAIHHSFQAAELFPSFMIRMIKIGEESGTLEVMLEKTAEFYEADISYWINNFSHVLEPLIIMILGVLIGGLVIAMYLPIFKLGTVI